MPSTPSRCRVLDLVVSGRLFTLCWLGASLGLSILQMRLLAQAWQESPHALFPACLVSLWTAGSLIGMRLRNAYRLWGMATFAGSLFWILGPSVVLWQMPRVGVPTPLVSLVPLALVPLLLGASSSVPSLQQGSVPSS